MKDLLEGARARLADEARARIAWVFPGQGAQFVGMGKDLYRSSEAARRVFEQADQILGFSLSRLCFEGPEEVLEDTEIAQPAILTVSVAYLESLREKWQTLGRKVAPMFVAGHSLGQYSAMVAAGALDFGDALRLVRERGRLMKETGASRPGGMAAVLGLSPAEVEAICAACSQLGVVSIANANSPDQVVISGEEAALERASELAKERGARRVVRLAISIASHSPLMQRASIQIADLLGSFQIRDPQVPVVANFAGRLLTTAEEVRRELAEHTHRPVEWVNAVRQMVEGGAQTFVEIGPGGVLSGLIRRIAKDVEALTAAELASANGSPSRPL